MESEADDATQGVLLYYKYVTLSENEREAVASWSETLCKDLALVGRVRVALDGINVTLGGNTAQLQEHIAAVQAHPLVGGPDIDFKLAISSGAVNEQASHETGFKDLRVLTRAELVTLGPLAAGIRAEQGGTHYSPYDFQDTLLERQSTGAAANTVLIDTRNCYESRIGRFDVEGIAVEVPQIRQFSDFPAWVDDNVERLRGKTVMMYCTGGVRCERASAYLIKKGAEFENVIQLEGGIQRYLEAFPDGGFFKGKNFVFDDRLAIAGAEDVGSGVVGACMSCGRGTDDYGPRLRCPKCRLLLLICERCAKRGEKLPLCEICAPIKADAVSIHREPTRKLKVLCLHGFRQTGNQFKGRTAALRKKLGALAEFVFVDAPHELPFWMKMEETDRNLPCKARHPIGQPRRAWLVSTETLNAMQERDRTNEGGRWESAPQECTYNQYLSETEGWRRSWQHLKHVLETQGPFDGIMGMSQGAGVAAHLCALQHLVNGQLEIERRGRNAPSVIEEWGEACAVLRGRPFRFAWLCSGYEVAPTRAINHLLDLLGPIAIPSLHLWGTNGRDKQISPSESRSLADLFEEGQRQFIEHGGGHFIPCSSPFIDLYRSFLTPLAKGH